MWRCSSERKWSLLAAFATLFSVVSSEYSTSWMTTSMCETKLESSQMIMESEVMESDERQIRIWRNDNEIFSGESYNPLERLRVSVSNPGVAYLYEIHGAAVIVNGTCGGSRIVSSGVIELRLPDHGDYYSDITVVAGWANVFDHVKMTPKFVIVHKEETRKNSDKQIMIPIGRFHKMKKLFNSFYNSPEATETLNFIEEKEDASPDPSVLPVTTKGKMTGQLSIQVNKVPALVSLMREARLAVKSPASGIKDPKSTVPDAPTLGELLDFRGSDRVVLSPSERAKEMQKIRDKQLFGMHGQRSEMHNKQVLVQNTVSDYLEKSLKLGSVTYARFKVQHPILLLMGQVFACFPLAVLIFRVHSKRRRLFRCLWKKRGLL